jgi:hypothetical protein
VFNCLPVTYTLCNSVNGYKKDTHYKLPITESNLRTLVMESHYIEQPYDRQTD